MLVSLTSSLLSLFWVFLMLLFVVYFFSLIILNGIVADYHTGLDNAIQKQLKDNYGTLIKTLLSLFMCISGGEDWSALYKPLLQLNWLYGAFFMFYIYFAVFGVLNVVTSVFVDATQKASLCDHEHVVQCELERNMMYMKSCRRLFQEADKNASGMLTWEELDEYLKDEKMQAFLGTLQLDESQARALYSFVDVNGDNEIAIDEFANGCVRLKGSAKAVDVIMLRFENERILAALQELTDLNRHNVAALEARLDVMQMPPQRAHPDVTYVAPLEVRNDHKPTIQGIPPQSSTTPEALPHLFETQVIPVLDRVSCRVKHCL